MTQWSDNWSDDYVSVNGIRLHYYRTGGDKPPLVLSHGITDNGLCWTRAAQILQEAYDVIMVDARGHGLSDKPEGGYSADQHAADLAGLIEQLGLERPRLMGHSMGGGTITALAARYPSLPGRIVLEDPPWRTGRGTPEERSAAADEWRTNLLARQALSVDELVAEGRAVNPAWDEAEFGPWSAAKMQVSPNVVKYITETTTPWSELVPKIACPTLLVTADTALGAIVSPETAQQVQQMNDRIQVAHIPNAGHNVRREQFEEFMRVVQAFLADE